MQPEITGEEFLTSIICNIVVVQVKRSIFISNILIDMFADTLLFRKVSRKITKISILKFNGRLKKYRLISHFFAGKSGLEIGGPSDIFSSVGYIPVYQEANSVDGCNFSNSTVWEDTISEGNNYKHGNSLLGYQHIIDGTDLSALKTENYDFILSSHSLEHIANPLKAMKEWTRVLKTGGALCLVVPDKNFTFDHKRQVTSFSHLLDDYACNKAENDLTHLEEILQFHDLKRDVPAGGFTEFKSRSLENHSNRCLHHHVFDFNLLVQIFKFLKLKMVVIEVAWPLHLIVAGLKEQEPTT